MLSPFLRLPFSFEVAKLVADYEGLMQREWKRHFNSADFEGNWDGLALRSSSGDALDIRAHPDAKYVDTPLMPACPYLRGVIELFKCPKEGIRLLRLAAGAEIKEHKDAGARYASGSFRIHVPIRTNPGVRFRVGGEDVPMQPGECWYADFSLTHSVRNDGASDRIHLVIDAMRNEWTDTVFRQSGYDFDAEQRSLALPIETRRQMVEHLLAMDTDTSRKMAARLRAEIGAERLEDETGGKTR